MLKHKRFSFQNPGKGAWQYLAIAAIVVLYLMQIVSSLKVENPLVNGIGADFRGFWGAGYIANTSGYADVYNLERLRSVQQQILLLSNYAKSASIVPAPLLPVFIIIFQAFALIRPIPSFIIWSLLNLIGLVLYLRFFLQKFKIPAFQRLVLIGVIAFPTFSNLFWGQVDLLLLICVGEFIRNILNEREFQAGLWIGGLILKPQLLILIGPVLLLQRKWKLLGGFCSTILAALVASLLLGKIPSLIALATLLTKYASGLPSNSPELMMNWRMIGLRLSGFLPATISWGIAVAGMVATTLAAFLLWRKPIPSSSPAFLIAFTGTLAASMAVTWHSHIHMAMALLPPLFYLYGMQAFPHKLFNWWIFGLPIIIKFTAQSFSLLGLKYNYPLPGLCFFIFNLLFLIWAWRAIKLKSMAPPATP